ncbi:MAG: hypothetical protein ACON4Z_05745, partial [Planctomycetota bacterium]
MNRSRSPFWSAALALAAACPGVAQQQPTSLAALTQRADVIALASVTNSVLAQPQLRRVVLRSDEVLKGALGATFTLTEPAGRCCGRSLFTLQAGHARLVFLRRVGPTLHVLAGERGLVPAEPELVADVRALLDAGGGAALTNLLVQQLTATTPRVADDAAAALAAQPALSLSDPQRAEVAA